MKEKENDNEEDGKDNQVGSRANLLPEGEMSFQLMEGSGLPLAWHNRVMLEPSLTTISLDRLMIFGGTVKTN